jgi:hypothetical protein
MDEETLITVTDAGLYRPLLACGHWGLALSPKASLFEQDAMDAEWCPVCVDDRYLDVRLQVAILNDLEVVAEHEGGR